MNISLIVIPLVLSSFTHLWNPIGFPSIHIDEGHYMRRSINVLEGLGPQEGAGAQNSGRYDHPYFGQLFLAGLFKIIGYPDSLGLIPGEISSTEKLFFVPRVLMGLLAVVDTFLIYKIAEYRYNRTVGLIASILFAVMPYTVLTRRIMLDSIQLPFILSSILLALYIKDKVESKENSLFILISGFFLGIAIFTKIPAFTMIPLIGYLIYSNRSSNKLKSLGMWFIPVLFVPLIWPVYAITVGDFDEWVDGIIWQSNRIPRHLEDALGYFFKTNPLILLLGIPGIIIAGLKKDFFPLLGSLPFFIFLYLIDYVSAFHFIPIFPMLCIAVSVFIMEISRKVIGMLTAFKSSVINQTEKNSTNRRGMKIGDNKLTKRKIAHYILPISLVLIIGATGLVNTIKEITNNTTTTYLQILTFVSKTLDKNFEYHGYKDKIVVISSPRYLWVPDKIFDIDQHQYLSYFSSREIRDLNKTDRFLVIVDKSFMNSMSKNDSKGEILRLLYNNSTTIGEFVEDADLNELRVNNDRDLSKVIEVRTNSPVLVNVGSPWSPVLPP